MKNESPLLVDDARARVLAQVQPVGDEVVPLVEAGGRIVAETLRSRRDLPAVDNSAMDGVGVRVDDVKHATRSLPVRLRVAGAQLPGGTLVDAALEPGTVVRIMTGAPIPPGVDAVIMRELTDETDVANGTIAVLESPPLGQHIRRRGEDVHAGDVVAEPGDVLTPARLNLVLSAGHVSARVQRAPVVAIVASGDELREVGEHAGLHDVVNSNAHAVAAAVRALGCRVHLLGVARDNLDDHVRVLRAGLFADVLLTIGGVSMGTHDFVRPALEQLGATLELWRVAMRPGKPIAMGRAGDVVVFGLPGNPVSSLVAFELFVRPALLKMSGAQRVMRPRWRATLAEAFVKRAGLEHWARGVATLGEGALEVTLLEGQGSHQISRMARANALVRFPVDVERVEAGAFVELVLLEEPLTQA
jgi:molybdopterin molybdotransferase